MSKQITILKAKLVKPKGKDKDGWHMEIHFEEQTAKAPFRDKRESPINPHPDLIAAFNRLAPHIAALTEQYDAEGQLDSLNIEARGYTLDGEEEKEGITITGQRKISSNRQITLNTPFLKWETGENTYENITKLNADIDACNKEVLAYLVDGKYGTVQPGEIFHPDNVEQELDNQRPTAFSSVAGALMWAKVKENKIILAPGHYDDGLKEQITEKLEKAGGVVRENQFLIWDFKEDPTDTVNTLSKKKNKYLQAAA